MRRNSGLAIAGTLVGGPFAILIKVSLYLFVILLVAPFWLLFKLVQLLAGIDWENLRTPESNPDMDRLVAESRARMAARKAEHERRMARIQTYSNRR